MFPGKYCHLIIYILLIFPSVIIIHAEAQTGSELFVESRCSRCHTIGRGRFVGPDLYDISKKYNKQQIMAWIINPEIVYSQTGKKPYNEGYPPMPNMSVNDHYAEIIAEFLLNNKIKKAEKDTGRIEGVLINESTGKGAEDVDIYLKSFIGDRLTGEKLQITDEKGKFGFDMLSFVNSYSVIINHEGLEYETAKMVFPPESATIKLDLPLYDTTEDDSNIFLNLNHEIISVGDKRISFAEIYDFENRGNKIFIGNTDRAGKGKTLKFYIPENAVGFSIVEGLNKDNIERDKNIIYDTSGFPPGSKRVVLTYDIPFDYGTNVIKKEILFNLANMLLLIDDKSNLTTVDSLRKLDPVTIENISYKRWIGENLPAGSRYEIKIINKLSGLKYINIYPVIIFAVIFLAAFLIGVINRSEKQQ